MTAHWRPKGRASRTGSRDRIEPGREALDLAASPNEARAPRQATHQDVLDAPVHLVAETVNGTVRMCPRPAPPHREATAVLAGELHLAFHRGSGGPGGWRIHVEPELHLEDDVLIPDLAAWRRERMPHLPDTAWFTLAPDWVCEVVSPSTWRVDLEEKRPVYAREGVGHLWKTISAATCRPKPVAVARRGRLPHRALQAARIRPCPRPAAFRTATLGVAPNDEKSPMTTAELSRKILEVKPSPVLSMIMRQCTNIQTGPVAGGRSGARRHPSERRRGR